MWKPLFFIVALIEGCYSFEIDPSLPLPHFYSCLFYLGTFVFLSVVYYIFYPAYINVGVGLGSTTTILAGDGKSDQDNTLSFVIPAYNEAERLPIMLDATLEFLHTNRKDVTQLFRAVVGQKGDTSELLIHCEFIIVNDGSTDDTDIVAKKYAANVKHGDTVKLISMHKNCGKGGAVKTGMLKSSGQLCLMVDADGATDISDGLPKVLKDMKCLVSEYQRNNSSNNPGYLPPAAVFGSRAHLEEESSASRSKIRTLLMHAFHFFVKTLCSARIKDTQCGFKLFTRSAVVSLFTNLHLRRW
mmetsp:Transcript_22258/g.46550  ORF Transcript_22258/g.46550 Transcript_22258/m.46550 type:complete len:300 (+) Transcript_22258:326-1225(+)